MNLMGFEKKNILLCLYLYLLYIFFDWIQVLQLKSMILKRNSF